MKVVFFGTPDFVEPVIKALEENFELLEVFRNPKEISNKTMQQLNNLRPDIFVVASFGKIFSKEFLNIPRIGSINIHPSLLPKYRGPTPVQTTLLNGDKITGVTVIKMDKLVDHGPVILQKEEKILDNDTSATLLNRLFQIGAKMLPNAISKYVKGQINPSVQDESKATLTHILKRESGHIDLNNPQSVETLDRMIKAFYPWPGVYTKFKVQNEKLKIVKFLPGDKVQVEGKKPMTYKDFVNGYSEGKTLLSSLDLKF